MSDFTKEAIEKIEELVLKAQPVRVMKIDGVDYTPDELERIDHDSRPVCINVGTLSSFCDYIKLNPERIELSNCFIHVEAYNQVVLKEKYSGLKKFRTHYVSAEIEGDINPFRFGNWYSNEDLIINLQAHFQDTPDKALILKRIGNITAEKKNDFADDGISQKVIAKTGIAETGEVKVPNPVTLKPYRTFREIGQPESTFVFRVKANDEKVSCALFEADGAAWKLAAIMNIHNFIEGYLGKDVKIPILS